MKNIFYLLTMFSLVFASCDPLEDVYSDLDALNGEETIVGDAVLTLTEDDYKALEVNNNYFENVDEVKQKLPSFIQELYPVWGQGSTVLVNYNLDNQIPKSSYTVSESDYTALGLSSLESSNDFQAFFALQFPTATKGSLVDLTYKTSPDIIDYELTNDDYDLVGNGRFDNFDIRPGSADESEEARRIKIQTILLNNFPDAELGTKYDVSYKTYDGSAGTASMTLELNENSPSGTITPYTLTNADYAFVGNDRFNNFDIRPGRAEETIESRRLKIESILINNFPGAVSGDFYDVTYAIYDGAPGTRMMLLQFDGTNWNIFSALTYDFYTFAFVEKTSRFALTSEWAMPYEITNDDYSEMGQRFNNFDGRTEEGKNEALRLMSVLLGQKYPYAAANDYVAVQYKLFVGSTITANANFEFDGSVWVAIPEVIGASLQFGFENGAWVPDNTIKYTLTNADYELVGNGRFNNFDVRPGRDEETVEARRLKISTILLTNFPQYGEGQKFSVSYDVWKPGNDTFIMNVVHNGTEYILQ